MSQRFRNEVLLQFLEIDVSPDIKNAVYEDFAVEEFHRLEFRRLWGSTQGCCRELSHVL